MSKLRSGTDTPRLPQLNGRRADLNHTRVTSLNHGDQSLRSRLLISPQFSPSSVGNSIPTGKPRRLDTLKSTAMITEAIRYQIRYSISGLRSNCRTGRTEFLGDSHSREPKQPSKTSYRPMALSISCHSRVQPVKGYHSWLPHLSGHRVFILRMA